MKQWLLAAMLMLVAGCGSPSFLVTPVSSSQALEEDILRGGKWNAGKVVVINIDGVLAIAKSEALLGAAENPMSLFQQQIDALYGDDDVKAVVLRINSPGGTVSAADAMYTILKRYKEHSKVPVVAATSEVCASGGYYIACAADKIIAQPTSVVGSIGVIFNSLDAADAMAKLGLKNEAIKSGPNKDMGSWFKHLEPGERALMQEMVDEYFARFQSVVRSNRHLKNDDTFKMATDGRVFSGEGALKVGLVDGTGLLDDAIDVAKRLAKSPGAKVVTYRRPFAYNGSIYANGQTQPPRANVMQLEVPGVRAFLPSGFYYLWQP